MPGLTGACNLYRVTPMKPPLPGGSRRRASRRCRASGCTVEVPTLVLWALDDAALLPACSTAWKTTCPARGRRRCPAPRTGSCTSSREFVASEIEAFQRSN